MADAAVQFLLENLQQLLTYHSGLIRGAEKEVAQLQNDLRLFKSFLKDTSKKRRRENSLSELVRQIRDVVYKAEDVIDSFVIQAADPKSTSYFTKWFKGPSSLHEIAVEVKRVMADVDKIYGGKSRLQLAQEMMIAGGDPGDELPEAPLVRQENIVGFEDEEEKLKSYINEQTQELDVISIIGMPGLGKTTLAGKIYRDSKIEFEFPTRIWVYVSQEFSKKDVFLSILKQLVTSIDEAMYQKDEQELAEEVKTRLKGGKFFMVMDDVWTASDWDKLQIALPKDNNMGKIIITSRNEEVARHANRHRPPHKLRFLTHAESWLLLNYEVFGKPESPNELEHLGKLIATHCGGLPLAIVVIGGILVKKFTATEDMRARINAWTKVSTSVQDYLKEDPDRRMEKIIALSYDKLPYHLRACFLYLGIFPEDFEIPAWKLTRMWIAEGFIQEKENVSLEETAENYLEDLINRNLVRIEKMRSDGKVKTCRIHDMLRDFCKTEAGSERENFLQEIKKSSDGVLKPPAENIKTYRRLCMHNNVMALVSVKPVGPHVRTFVCYSKEDINLPKESISAIPAAFKLLRVLEAKPIKFSKIPNDMYQLVRLKYIHLSFDGLKVLPQPFSKLWNIQTLIVDTTVRTLEIKAEIWKMMHLTHLKTNASTTLPKPGKTSSQGATLRTLGTISPESCTYEVFDRARNLKKLGIRGKLNTLLDLNMDSLGRLGNLEKLKLLNDVFPIAPSEGPMRALPPPYKFPPKLKSLTLSDTYLDWCYMSVLDKLENLIVLKLKSNAFVGELWKTSDGGFSHLEILHIGRTNLAIWQASAHHFPRLRRLELRNCENIRAIPDGFSQIPSFQLLDLYRASHAAASAKAIRAKAKSGFKLIIYPPTE